MESPFKQARLNKSLLWIPPYDNLGLWTRIWLDQLKSIMGMRRYEQSARLNFLSKSEAEALKSILDFHMELKKKAEEAITKTVSECPEWANWGKDVVGLGKHSLGKLLGLIGNPAARTYISSLWRHCGLAVINGKIEKPTKGEPLHFNRMAKARIYLIVSQFLRSYPKTPNFYGEAYYEFKKETKQKHPDWSDLHVHLSCILRVGRLFVSHLHQVSREAQGLPAHKPYPIEPLGHAVYYKPEIALHIYKRRAEVEDAIMEVWSLLDIEPDEEAKRVHENIVRNLKEKLAGG